MKKFVDFVFAARKGTIALTILLTLFFGYQLRYVKVNSDVFSYLPKTDRAVALSDEIADEFGGNALVLVTIEDKNLFSKASFERLARLTEKLKAVDGLSSVTSLADVIDIKKAPDGGIEISKLVDPTALPESDAAYADLKTYVLSQNLYRGRLVSTDGDMTSIICQFTADADKVLLVKRIREVVKGENLTQPVYFGGVPILTGELADAVFSDLKILIPIVTILIVVTLLLSFGTWRGVIVPLLSVGIATIWTIGLMSLLRVPLTIISDIIPVLLIAIGTAPCIHILGKYDEDVTRRYGSIGEEPRKAFCEVGLRVILAALTIIFGFSSFIFGSYLTMIREFGIFSSIGVFFSLLLSIFFVPALLSYITITPKKVHRTASENTRTPLTKVMNALGDFVLKNEATILVAGCIVLVLGIAGIPRIERKVDIIDYFKVKNPVHTAETILEEKFGGSRPIQIRFKGDMRNPFVLKEIARTEKYLSSSGFIHNTLSAADLISRMNDVMGEGKIVPEATDKVSNLYFLIEGEEMLTRVVNSDKTAGLVTAMVGILDVTKMRSLVDSVDTYLASLDSGLVCVAYADLPEGQQPVLYKEQQRRIVRQIIWDAKKLSPEAVINEKLIANTIAHFESPLLYSAAESLIRDSLGPELATAVLLCLPPEMRKNSFLVDDINGDILELGQKRIALPAQAFGTLGLNAATTETIPLVSEHTGMPLIYQHLDNSLIESQVQNFIMAIIFIFILLALQLRSIKSGLLGLTPIVLTVVLVFGIMGFAHVPLDVATVLVGSIALGIGIDYSIHFSMRFKSYFKDGATARDALDSTLQTTGKAIIINMLAVTMGFITLMFAGLVPLQRFGLLVSITMIGSGLGALTLLPSLILIFKKKKSLPTTQREVV